MLLLYLKATLGQALGELPEETAQRSVSSPKRLDKHPDRDRMGWTGGGIIEGLAENGIMAGLPRKCPRTDQKEEAQKGQVPFQLSHFPMHATNNCHVTPSLLL